MEKILKNFQKTQSCSSTYLDCTDTYDRYVGRYKVIHSEPVYEIYSYQYPVKLGVDTSKHRTGIRRKENNERKEEYGVKRATRARNTVKRLARMNFTTEDKFLTCTFADNVTDVVYANNEFRKFIKRLNRRFRNIVYITAIQFQKRGAIHYHCLIHLPYISKVALQEIWGNGIVDIRKLNNVDNIGAYMSRYMLKDALDERLKGKKCYFTTRGLKRPSPEYLNAEGYRKLLEVAGLEASKVAYSSSYESERNGIVTYTEYNITPGFKPRRRKS